MILTLQLCLFHLFLRNKMLYPKTEYSNRTQTVVFVVVCVLYYYLSYLRLSSVNFVLYPVIQEAKLTILALSKETITAGINTN